ncbi:hypothetical protein OG582_38450 [Streptomyces anulatus]|uniref:hypothetical protein n=1 Tax=Streptomyces anulatus TaxID=1892 RepID=UPI002253731E|nr:hypothetical protein [Streptomyces anulatus]MCX4506632.1 hypothetical protein [Streptomyces anulatus]
MRTRKSVTSLFAVGGLALGLMSIPAFAAPADPVALERQAGDAHAQDAWHTKYAKNVSGGPKKTKGRVCVFVRTNPRPLVTIGKACFKPKGDKFWIKDLRADGLHLEMRAIYSGNYQTVFNCKNYKGKRAGWTVCSFAKQMKENRMINFSLLAYDKNSMKHAGITAYANT